MSITNDYKTPILDFLKGKYTCDFEIHRTTTRFSGSDGAYIYAVAESKEFSGETFEIYCYPDNGETTGENIVIDGEKYVIYEKYAEIYFANQMKQEIEQLLDDDVFVACKIKFDCGYALHYSVTDAQFAAGLKACLDNDEFYSTVSVYIVADEKADIEEIRELVESYNSNFNAYEQYLYFSVALPDTSETVSQHYEDNRTSFGKHMLECEQISYVECTEFRRNQGIVERTVEKG